MRLRKFSEIHIDEDCSQLGGEHNNALFHNCKFHKLNGLSLVDCDLYKSEFTTESIRDALRFAVTLNCHSFRGVKLSPLIFDLILMLLTMSEGNDEKRRQLIEVIGQSRYDALNRVLERVE